MCRLTLRRLVAVVMFCSRPVRKRTLDPYRGSDFEAASEMGRLAVRTANDAKSSDELRARQGPLPPPPSPSPLKIPDRRLTAERLARPFSWLLELRKSGRVQMKRYSANIDM